jgi:hypothetical protein
MLILLIASLLSQADAGSLHPSNPQWRAEEGYQGARWGMPEAQIRRLYRDAQDIQGGLIVPSVSVAGLHAHLVFSFGQGRLKAAGLVFDAKKNNRSTEDLYAVLKSALSKKYGTPMADDDSSLEPTCLWATRQSKIMIEQESIRRQVQVVYVSSDLVDLRDELPDAASKDL